MFSAGCQAMILQKLQTMSPRARCAVSGSEIQTVRNDPFLSFNLANFIQFHLYRVYIISFFDRPACLMI